MSFKIKIVKHIKLRINCKITKKSLLEISFFNWHNALKCMWWKTSLNFTCYGKKWVGGGNCAIMQFRRSFSVQRVCKKFLIESFHELCWWMNPLVKWWSESLKLFTWQILNQTLVIQNPERLLWCKKIQFVMSSIAHVSTKATSLNRFFHVK